MYIVTGCSALEFQPVKGLYPSLGGFMAIQDYLRSIAVSETVSKGQVFRYLELQFARADRNHDGELDIEELQSFIHTISHPETDQR